MDPMEEIRQTFFVECEELLETLEAGLIAMGDGTHDDETVNAVFRAVHSIKGGAGAFALDGLVSFAHKFENVLDLMRSNKLETTPDVLDVLLRSGDVLSDLVRCAQDGLAQENEASRALINELAALAGEKAEASAGESGPAFDAAPISLDDGGEADFQPMPMALDDLEDNGTNRFRIVFSPHAQLYERGSEITLLMRALDELGTLTVRCETVSVPPLESLDLKRDVLALTAELETGAERTAVEEIFDFVDSECDLGIEEILPEAPGAAPAPPLTEEVAAAPQGPEEAASEASVPKADAAQAAAPRATVRVDVDRVDRLVNLVGELVITQAGITRLIGTNEGPADAEASNTVEEFKQLTRELQDSVMALRTQPVKALFQRMQRISREAASASGKAVRLKTVGEATEVDKTVIERLSDPLTHMIRNAIDHGLENPEKRAEAGKSSEGVVKLIAAHRSGRVVIEVSDDGGGINRERVRSIAIEKGLVRADATLSNAEIDHLLFAPGFSTAKEVTNLSGRGVGMDVVKRSIQALGGRISIQSQPGAGTTFSISLPLTLAVLDGMIVTVDGHTVVVPLTAILETHKPPAEEILKVGGEGLVLRIRDDLVPVVDIGDLFGYRPPVDDLTKHVVLLVETEEARRAALVVDTIVDQRQDVIKGLEVNYGHIEGIAAATILGDGTIALILDTDDLVAGSTGGQPQALNAVA